MSKLFDELLKVQEMDKKTREISFRLGSKDMLEKVLVIIDQWQRGLYSNEELKKILKDYHQICQKQ